MERRLIRARALIHQPDLLSRAESITGRDTICERFCAVSKRMIQ